MSGTHALMARLLYGSGLRLMECVRLRAATSKTSLTKQQNQGSVTGTAVTLKSEMLERGILVARRAGRAQPEGRGTQLTESVAGLRQKVALRPDSVAGLQQR